MDRKIDTYLPSKWYLIQNRRQLIHSKEINIEIGNRPKIQERERCEQIHRIVSEHLGFPPFQNASPRALFSCPVIWSLPWLLSYPSIQHPPIHHPNLNQSEPFITDASAKLNHSSFPPQHILTFLPCAAMQMPCVFWSLYRNPWSF